MWATRKRRSAAVRNAQGSLKRANFSLHGATRNMSVARSSKADRPMPGEAARGAADRGARMAADGLPPEADGVCERPPIAGPGKLAPGVQGPPFIDCVPSVRSGQRAPGLAPAGSSR